MSGRASSKDKEKTRMQVFDSIRHTMLVRRVAVLCVWNERYSRAVGRGEDADGPV